MPYTTKGLWYPPSSASPNVPLDMQAFATSIDNQLNVGPIQKGILDGTTFEVRQRQAGATMSVDVLAGNANQGAFVPISASLNLLVFAPTSVLVGSPLNLTIGNNSSGNPRVDSIILRYTQATATFTFMVLAGTASAGATLDNLTGAATLTAFDLLLANVLVANGAVSITNANIRDRRPWARGAYYKFTRTTGNYTMAQNTLTFVDSTNMQPRLEIASGNVRMKITGVIEAASAADGVYFSPQADSVGIDGLGSIGTNAGSTGPSALQHALSAAGAGARTVPGWDWEGSVTPGSRLLGPAWCNGQGAGNTITMYGSTTRPCQLVIQEVLNSSQKNNPTTTG